MISLPPWLVGGAVVSLHVQLTPNFNQNAKYEPGSTEGGGGLGVPPRSK